MKYLHVSNNSNLLLREISLAATTINALGIMKVKAVLINCWCLKTQNQTKKLHTRKLEHMQNYNNHNQKQEIHALAKS